MFGLFKKNISDQELVENLAYCIIKIKESISTQIIEEFENSNPTRINEESFFYSVWMFTKRFPPNEISTSAIGKAIQIEFGKLTKDKFHEYGKKSVERSALYSNIYNKYFTSNNAMTISTSFNSLFFGDSEIVGTNVDEIPLNINMGITSSLTSHITFLEFLKLGKVYDDIKINLKKRFKIAPHKLD